MSQELDAARNVYLDRDEQGVVRGLLHFNEPFESAASTPQLAAADYLNSFSDLLGIESVEMQALGQEPGTQITDDKVEYRFLQEKAQEGVVTVAFAQTVLSLPIWEAGIAVQIQTDPFRVLSSQSTRDPKVSVHPPRPAQVKKAESTDEAELAVQLGLAQAGKATRQARELHIQRRQLVVYEFERLNRFRDRPDPAPEQPPIGIEDFEAHETTTPMLPLPPLPNTLKEGEHYVCLRVDFGLHSAELGVQVNWVALLEVRTLAVVYLRAFADDLNGLVFNIEPMTDNGGPLPSATSAQLNPVRVSKTLLGLDAPDGANVQHLSGDTITISDAESPAVAPPTEPGGTDFNFDARTDNFAAVNAYVHCDQYFRLCDSMGFTRAGLFGGTTFPVTVDHRGFGGTGITVNAHCLGNAGGNGIGATAFALADLGDTANPIGIACDLRIVLHELGGHGILYNHVSSANFGFSHSAGDSVGVVFSDPGSQAPDRFQTFPWVNGSIARRQDRTPAGGWGWNGSIGLNPFSGFDPGGYNNEQILSSSHFRLYQAIGGDASDLPTQQFASRMVLYLMIKAISTLTPATNPATAAPWVSALQTADSIDWASENITGGAYSKVIRWAFEKQGLFQSQGQATPNNLIGDPPAVDVYIDDGRHGEYQYIADWWENQNIWNRTAADGGTTHQDPVIGVTNFAYVKIKNRGTQDATNVLVKGYHANPAAGLSFPNDWLPMTTAQLPAPNVAANNGAEITVGPFDWVPFHLGHECVIMIVSATGDASNVDNIHPGDLIPDWRLIPNDNNIGQRNVAPVAGGGGTTGVTSEFDGLEFELKNPLTKDAVMELRPSLPPLLAERGWKLEFTNRGGAAFVLKPGESRNVVMRMVAGAPFTTADVEAAGEPTVKVAGFASGILVGGLSYALDPKLVHPTRQPRKKKKRFDECARTAEALIDCLEMPEDVERVRVRKITVDIEFEDDC